MAARWTTWLWFLAVCVFVVAVIGSLLAYREHLLNTQDIVTRTSWPKELVDLADRSAATGDSIEIEEVDVRYAGFITTYAWRMPATNNRLKLHLEQFHLAAVPPNGIEQQRIDSRWPHAWDPPTTNCDLYANPVGLPGADDGEFEFVLLHDKTTQTIYFYYYFNF